MNRLHLLSLLTAFSLACDPVEPAAEPPADSPGEMDPMTPEPEAEPETPETPDDPEDPETPETPDDPETPSEPERPEEPTPDGFAYSDDPALGPDGHPLGWTEATHAKGADPAWDALFDVDQVHRIDIAMPASTYQTMLDDLTTLLGEPGQGGGRPGGGMPPGGRPGGQPGGGGAADLIGDDPVWVPVTVTHDGLDWHHVGMRFKGNSSLSTTWRNGGRKIGFRLTFDKYEDEHPAVDNQRFHGFKKMTFAAGFGDPTMARDIAAGELLRAMGIPAARAALYEVWVDTGDGPAFWGLYTMIEDPSDQLVEAWFDDDDGNMYKPDGTGADWTAFDEAGFEKKSNEDEADWSDVEAAIAALHADQGDPAAWRAQFEATFDAQHFVRWLAINTAMVNWDVYGAIAHNYYLYGDPAQGGRLVWIPWDHNEAMRSARQGSGRLTLDDVDGNRWPLIRRVMDDPVYRQLYRDTLAELAEGVFTEEWLFPMIERVHALAGPSLAAEAQPFTQLQGLSEYESALEGGAEAIFPHIRARREAVLELLDSGWPN